jgi:chloramphenicol O-acetyltransferase type B
MPLIIGPNSYGNPIMRGNHNTVTIGKFCSIATGVILDCGFNHNHRFVTTYPIDVQMFMGHLPPNRPPVGDITIGNDVWIGEDSLIMNDVTICDGAVIGARSIITKNVEPYEIVVGHHRSIGFRFAEDQVKRLLKLQWWNWPEERVKANAHLMLSENIDFFLENYV